MVWIVAAALLAGVASAPQAAADQKKKKQPLAEQFLIFGTVFEESGRLLPGAELRVRRAGEKKVRWRARSDRRGEFGIRVPTGEKYELTVEAKGFEEQEHKIDAKNGTRVDLVLRMKPEKKEPEKKEPERKGGK